MPNLCCTTIFTERLTLKPVSSSYEDDLFYGLTDEVARYLVFQPTGDIEDTRDFIRRSREEMEAGMSLKTVILNRTTGTFLGYANLRFIDTREPKVGIWLSESAQHKGFGRETVAALRDFADTNLDYDFLSYPVATENPASRKLAESLGGIVAHTGTFTNSRGEVHDEVTYHIPKATL